MSSVCFSRNEYASLDHRKLESKQYAALFNHSELTVEENLYNIYIMHKYIIQYIYYIILSLEMVC